MEGTPSPLRRLPAAARAAPRRCRERAARPAPPAAPRDRSARDKEAAQRCVRESQSYVLVNTSWTTDVSTRQRELRDMDVGKISAWSLVRGKVRWSLVRAPE